MPLFFLIIAVNVFHRGTLPGFRRVRRCQVLVGRGWEEEEETDESVG